MAQRRSSLMGLFVFLFCFSISSSNAQRMFLDSYQKRALQDSHSNGMVGQNNIGVNWVGGQGIGSGSGFGSGSGNGVGVGTGSGTGTGSGGQGSTGYGSGTGTGRGYGSGSGNGNGNGYGSGSGTGSGFNEPGCGTYTVPGYPNPGQNPYYGCGCQPDPCSQIGYVQGNMPTINNNNNMGKKTSNEDSKAKPPLLKYEGSHEPVPPPANTMHEDSWYPPPRPQRIQALEYEIPPGKVKVEGYSIQDDDDEPPIKEKIDAFNPQEIQAMKHVVPPGKEKVDGFNTQEIQAQGFTQQLHH